MQGFNIAVHIHRGQLLRQGESVCVITSTDGGCTDGGIAKGVQGDGSGMVAASFQSPHADSGMRMPSSQVLISLDFLLCVRSDVSSPMSISGRRTKIKLARGLAWPGTPAKNTHFQG